MKLKLAAAAVALAFSAPAFADYASIYQSGNDNYANVDQTNSGAAAYVGQVGDRNHVGYDYGDGYVSPGIVQINVTSGYGQVGQEGNDNFAWLYQQEGSNLQAVIQQGGWRCDSTSCTYMGTADNSYAFWYQTGQNQSVNVFQFGTGNYAYGYQYGSDNLATVSQNGTGNSVYGASQTGTGGDANVMNVTQTGSYNTAGYYYYSLTQYGAGNEMNITQDGTSNYVYQGAQSGTNNLMTISQVGIGHGAYATQYGTGNVMVLTQH